MDRFKAFYTVVQTVIRFSYTRNKPVAVDTQVPLYHVRNWVLHLN